MVNNAIYGNARNFNVMRNNYGVIYNIGFTEKRLIEWRSTFSQFRDWAVGGYFDAQKRSQLTKLSPSFVLEDEGLIFDTGINTGGHIACLKSIQYKGIFLKSGYAFATDTRFVFGSIRQNIVEQILYKNIRGVYYEKQKDPTPITLALSDNIELKMLLHINKGSPFWNMFTILVGAFSSPAGRHNLMQGDISDGAYARTLRNYLVEFFNEIADENRRTRKRRG